MPWKPADEQELFPSLGYLVSDWITENLVIPDGSRAGAPLVLTDDQYQFLIRLLRLHPDVEFDPAEELPVMQQRAFRYTSGCLSRSKGTGKSPFCAALAWAFALGPVVFDGWDENGQPMGRPQPSPWIQVLGVAQDNTINLWSALLACAEPENGAMLTRKHHGVDMGLTRVYLPNGRLEFVTTAAGTREGQRVTFAVFEESGYLTEANGGVTVANTVRRNVAKMGGVSVEITNAFVRGQESLAEKSAQTHAAEIAGKLRAPSGLLYDHREAPADTDVTDRRSLERGLRFAYQGAPWVSIDRLISEVWDPRNRIEDSRRFYLNQVNAAVNAWLDPKQVAGIMRGSDVEDGEVVTLGFDGSRQRAKGFTDSTALIGCRVSDGHLFEVPFLHDEAETAVWEQPAGPAGDSWAVPRPEVDAAVAEAFDRFTVVGFFADPAKWETYVDRWTALYGGDLRVKATHQRPVEWWMTGGRSVQIVRATERLRNAIVQGQTSVDAGSERLRQHLINARARETRAGIQIGKDTPLSPRKVDCAVAAILAFQARAEAVAAGIGQESPEEMFVPRRIR